MFDEITTNHTMYYTPYSVIRSGGTFGSVAMQWELSPSDNTVFTTTSATELFNDGQSMLEFTVEVRNE